MTRPALPKLAALPVTLPLEGAVRLELVEGVAVLRASAQVQVRIEELLAQQQEMALTASEARELDAYGEMDDYLSLVNRMVRNLMLDSCQSRADDLVG